MRADVGVMISASHNPYEDNGMKLFGPDGYKLSDAVEMRDRGAGVGSSGIRLAAPGKIGRAKRLDDAGGPLHRGGEGVRSARGLNLSGLKIVVDCANGAAYRAAPTVLWELGAEVIPLAVSARRIQHQWQLPGPRIRGLLQEHVCCITPTSASRSTATPTGVVLVDELGRLIDGDQLMATIAGQWASDGRLAGGGLVATVMSNLGLERYLGARKLMLVRTQGGRSQRPRAHARRRLQSRRRAIRPHHHDRSRHDR